MQETIQAEDQEDHSCQVSGDCRCGFHTGSAPVERSVLLTTTILTPIQLMTYSFGRFRLFMTQRAEKTDHVWLVMIKAMHALTRYAAAGIEGTGIDNSDFRRRE